MVSTSEKTTWDIGVASEEGLVQGGGEMGERIRAFDWASTPLGPMETWSPALRMMLRIMLANRFPQLLWWGPHYIQLYNDPYRPVPGTKHPEQSLGRPARECWAEIWHVIGPLIDRPFHGGPATWDDDIFLEVHRHGFFEESHFTIAYSPVPDETAPRGIGGVLATVHEITEKVIGERRVATLRDLGTHIGEAKTAEEACVIAARALESHPKDVPFALIYLLDSSGKRARLAGTAGVEEALEITCRTVDLGQTDSAEWPFGRALQEGSIQIAENLSKHFTIVPPGPWSDPPERAAVVPIPSNNPRQAAGAMVIGLSSRLKWDQGYRDFIDLMKTQIAAAIANARAYEEERKRAEALAQLDRAKTAFFSNVSHEFRTPLTLMLGPIEELLTTKKSGLSAEAKKQLELINRNGLRLLRLVNTLLDFSRIEAGRVAAIFEPTDLSTFTTELVSVFRSATEKAGLTLTLDCPKLREPVYVDREMWEKIVLNLISNAFKFTFEGGIKVSLGVVKDRVELRVCDTGVGIPAEEIPRIFERFHRVTNARSRTHEGSGIGLALVQELVKLHCGTVRVESQPGRGTMFFVTVPLGKEHLPSNPVGASGGRLPTAMGAAPFIEEALRWLPDGSGSAMPMEIGQQKEWMLSPFLAANTNTARARVLIADDNADMRQYVGRLLAEHYDVAMVADGEAALVAVRQRPPELVLSDVMMPRLDGVGLLHRLRRDPELNTIPVILLSARAGEESRVEGLQEGADDYLIKPFSARELLARVAAHIELARLRKQRKEELELLVAERTAKLQEMVSELEHFSYTITHDMRAPLRAMRGFAEVLRSDYREMGGVEQRMFLERIITAAARMDALIMDALSYSKAVRQELPLEPVDVAKLVRGMLDSYPEFHSSQADILIPDALPLVMGNEAGLTQCFSNLLGNAVKFVEPGKRPQVQIKGELLGKWVRLWVEDNGTGISERMLPRVFDMFSRGATSQAGTGVGLALVRKTANRMGGKVGVESQRGKGSRFWLELKAA